MSGCPCRTQHIEQVPEFLFEEGLANGLSVFDFLAEDEGQDDVMTLTRTRITLSRPEVPQIPLSSNSSSLGRRIVSISLSPTAYPAIPFFHFSYISRVGMDLVISRYSGCPSTDEATSLADLSFGCLISGMEIVEVGDCCCGYGFVYLFPMGA